MLTADVTPSLQQLAHLPELRAVGFSANRRLLRVQQLSYNPIRGNEAFTAVIDPVDVGGQHAPDCGSGTDGRGDVDQPLLPVTGDDVQPVRLRP